MNPTSLISNLDALTSTDVVGKVAEPGGNTKLFVITLWLWPLSHSKMDGLEPHSRLVWVGVGGKLMKKVKQAAFCLKQPSEGCEGRASNPVSCLGAMGRVYRDSSGAGTGAEVRQERPSSPDEARERRGSCWGLRNK